MYEEAAEGVSELQWSPDGRMVGLSSRAGNLMVLTPQAPEDSMLPVRPIGPVASTLARPLSLSTFSASAAFVAAIAAAVGCGAHDVGMRELLRALVGQAPVL